MRDRLLRAVRAKNRAEPPTSRSAYAACIESPAGRPYPHYFKHVWSLFWMSTEIVSANGPAVADGLLAERQRWAAAAIFTALAMASLDTAIANIALPAIAADLHVNAASVIWVVNVYQIALVATLLPLAALGEIVGHRRIYLGGLLLFTLASLACACAWWLPSLLTARAARSGRQRHY